MSTPVKIKPDSVRMLSNPEALAHLKKYVEKTRETTGTVPLLVSRVLEYLSKFSKIPIEKAEELREKLLLKGFKEETVVLIMNTCPRSVDELRALMEFEDKVYETSILEDVLNTLSEYCSSEKE
ncbi:MAG: RNA polymerase Rpb4 [Desulfurococcaceae archaeon]